MTEHAEAASLVRDHEDARLLKLIQDRQLLINVSPVSAIAIDAHGHKWQGADLREVLRQIK